MALPLQKRRETVKSQLIQNREKDAFSMCGLRTNKQVVAGKPVAPGAAPTIAQQAEIQRQQTKATTASAKAFVPIPIVESRLAPTVICRVAEWLSRLSTLGSGAAMIKYLHCLSTEPSTMKQMVSFIAEVGGTVRNSFDFLRANSRTVPLKYGGKGCRQRTFDAFQSFLPTLTYPAKRMDIWRRHGLRAASDSSNEPTTAGKRKTK